MYEETNIEKSGSVPLNKLPDGTYIGTWTLVWRVETDTYSFLIPNATNWEIKVGPNSGTQPILHISGIADTYTWRFNVETKKFTFILIGFSVLMLQPIVEAIAGWKND